MDIIDGAKIEKQLLEPAIDKINHETIPAAQTAGQAIVDGAVAQLSNVVKGLLLSFQGYEDQALSGVAPVMGAASELQKLLAKLNAGGEITITIHL